MRSVWNYRQQYALLVACMTLPGCTDSNQPVSASTSTAPTLPLTLRPMPGLAADQPESNWTFAAYETETRETVQERVLNASDNAEILAREYSIDVVFAEDSAQIVTSNPLAMLAELIAAASLLPYTDVFIEARVTDPTPAGRKLARQRAQSVRELLVAKGAIDGGRILALAAPDADPESRPTQQQNIITITLDQPD